MKQWKKMFVSGVALLLAVVQLAGCSGTGSGPVPSADPASESTQSNGEAQADNFNAEGMPIVNEKITLSGLGSKAPVHAKDWNEMAMFEEMEKRSNIHIEWETVDAASFEEKRNLIISGGEYPDIFMRGGFTAKDDLTYGSQGVLMPLNDLLEKYAPNFTALMEEYPEIRKTITCADGNIYSLPNINMVKGATTFKTWINQTWLDNLNLEMPQTTEELYEVLKAFKEQDANGNGDPNDELPLAGQGKTSDGSVDLFKWFYGYWGFQKIKIQDARFDVVDGQVRYMPTDDRYRSMVEYVGRLWSEGLIDQDYFTTDRNQLLSKMDQGIVGYSPAGNNNNMCGTTHRDEYVQADVLTGPYGDQISSYVNPMTLRGGVAISTSCEYPEALIRWIDYFYGEEGTALMRMGIEGETYIVNEDGEYEYTEYVTNNPDGLTQEMAIGTFTIWGGGGVPQVMTLKTDKSANTTEFNLAATEKIEPYIPDEVVSLNFTLEELDQLAMMEADIDKYVNQMTVAFITGSEPLNDDTWNAYVDQLNKMKLQDYTQIYADAYERYKNA